MSGQSVLNFREYGSKGAKFPVIILHGLFGSMDNLSPTARRVAETRWVITADLRNHGRSFHDMSMTYPVMAEDVFRLMEHLSIEKAVVLGHSMGGKVAMQMAAIAPEKVAALVVGDIAPVDYLPGHDNVLNALRNYNPEKACSRIDADKQFAAYIQESGVRQLLIKNLMRDKEGRFVWRINAAALLENYEAIRATPAFGSSPFANPVLFVKGSESDYLLAEHKPVIDQHYPKASLKVMTGTGHWLHAEKPDLFNGIVERFLSSID
ncbi:alpha/beta fold hydrolase [Parendozoicomonas sp. Alg238-R29]|uniref:alpha/beta fold hydrolase n=1 Tax=Parendozoicomonas sp. Alg238-R29 TaxID=2993446 RepID=UPI00248EB7AC|nr:alpha/beta fold hydrolase [Parendozoicomonas sp. Alg238-R29]